MIKARGIGPDGRNVLVLGLSHGNLDRLRAGEPIQFDGAPYGYPGTIFIFAGKDEFAMGALIQGENPGVKTILEKGDRP